MDAETPIRVVDTLKESLMPDSGVEAIIRAEKIEKYYEQPSESRIRVIAPTNLAIYPGEILALLGPSGSSWALRLTPPPIPGALPCCLPPSSSR